MEDNNHVIIELKKIKSYLEQAISYHDRTYLEMADDKVSELIKILEERHDTNH